MLKNVVFFVSALILPSMIFSQTMIKAIIFDCDGTLVDSEEAHYFSWQQTLRDRGSDLSLEDYIRLCVGKSSSVAARIFAEKLGNPELADQLHEQKKAYFLQHASKGLPPIQGTVDFARRLIQDKEKHGLKLGVASGAFKHEVMLNLKSLHIDEAFDVVLSGQDDLGDYVDPEGVNKPKPYIYLQAAKLLGVLPSECIVIEDSFTGVTASWGAGCLTVAIPNPYTIDHDFSKAAIRLESLTGMTLEDFLIAIQPKKQSNCLPIDRSDE